MNLRPSNYDLDGVVQADNQADPWLAEFSVISDIKCGPMLLA